MAELDVRGGTVAYELLGPEGGEVIVLTPGGRFSKDFPGVRPLAEALTSRGNRVLLWDRPNTGVSDIQLWGETESHMRAEVLGGLVEQLDVGPVYAFGGSGGARDSIVFTLLYPQLVKRLAVWSIVGGPFATMSLAWVYVMNEIRAVRAGGLDAVMTMPGMAGSWEDLIAANPRNRARLLEVGDAEFERVMWRWLEAYIPKPNEPIPGVSARLLESIDTPTLIIRGGDGDLDHPKRTSFEVHSLIRGSRLIDPPWPEDAWEQASAASARGEGSIFDPWVQAAPALLDFIDEAERR